MYFRNWLEKKSHSSMKNINFRKSSQEDRVFQKKIVSQEFSLYIWKNHPKKLHILIDKKFWENLRKGHGNHICFPPFTSADDQRLF